MHRLQFHQDRLDLEYTAPLAPAVIRFLLPFGAALLVAAGPPPRYDGPGEPRMQKLEAEIRALQRKVFPGGGGEKIFTPEFTNAPTRRAAPGRAATSPVTDLSLRLESASLQMTRLVNRLEEVNGRLARIESRVLLNKEGYRQQSSPIGGVLPASKAAAPSLADAQKTAPTGPSASRLERVRAIIKPETSDPADDEYSYGFRMWQAGFYPEARQQLKLFLTKYPRHGRVSFARNLLGRAFLDDGKPREAAPWFLDNYRSGKQGARAPDSLLFLAQTMHRLKDDKRACVALAEFSDVYAMEAVGRLRDHYGTVRENVTCQQASSKPGPA